MTFNVMFTCYYCYEVETEATVEEYEEDPEGLEEAAIQEAYNRFCAERRYPVADTTYDEVEVEVQ
jgi:hypothetical protein